MQVERGVFTAGAKSTQRSEGMNRVIKTTLNKKSNLLSVVTAFDKQVFRQTERSQHAGHHQVHYTAVASLASTTFPVEVAAIRSSCSAYAVKLVETQMTAGVAHYEILGPATPDNQYPLPEGERTLTHTSIEKRNR